MSEVGNKRRQGQLRFHVTQFEKKKKKSSKGKEQEEEEAGILFLDKNED